MAEAELEKERWIDHLWLARYCWTYLCFGAATRRLFSFSYYCLLCWHFAFNAWIIIYLLHNCSCKSYYENAPQSVNWSLRFGPFMCASLKMNDGFYRSHVCDDRKFNTFCKRVSMVWHGATVCCILIYSKNRKKIWLSIELNPERFSWFIMVQYNWWPTSSAQVRSIANS